MAAAVSTDWISSTKQIWEKYPAVVAKLDELQAVFGGFEMVGLDTSTMSESELVSLLDGLMNGKHGIDSGELLQTSSDKTEEMELLEIINPKIYVLIEKLSEMDLLGDPTERFTIMLDISKIDCFAADAIWDSLNASFDEKTTACICEYYNMAFRSKDAACLCNPKHPLFHG
jgi:hypothetical protein